MKLSAVSRVPSVTLTVDSLLMADGRWPIV
jgi:hypothetical protein